MLMTKSIIGSLCLFVFTTTGANAECRILNEAGAKNVVKFYAASSVCPAFKAKMPDAAMWALLMKSNNASGIPEALKESKDAANACMRVIMPFVDKASSQWLSLDRSTFCKSVDENLKAYPDWRSTLVTFGLL